jgi:hypothetical protein
MTFPTFDQNVTHNGSHGFMYTNTPVVSNRIYTRENIANMKSYLNRMTSRVAEEMERQYEGQILETQIIEFEKAFAHILGNASFFGPVQAAAEERAPIQAAAEDPDSRSIVGKIYSSAVGSEKHDSRSTDSQILSNDMHNVDASSATEQEQVQTHEEPHLPIEEVLCIHEEEDKEDEDEEDEDEEDEDEEEDEFLRWCYKDTDIPELVAAYERKPSNDFSDEDLYALEEMQKLFDRYGKLGRAWNWNCLLGRRTFEQNKKLWNLAQVKSVGERVENAYLEAIAQDEWDNRVIFMKRCWYKTDLCQERGGSFAKTQAELLSRWDTMVYLNWKRIADNDCMGLDRNASGWWTKFKKS